MGGGLAVTAVATTSASAQPGSLDASFGTSGVAVSTLGGNAVGANGVTIVPSGVTGAGDVVTAGWSQAPTATTPQFQVAELSPTGALSWQASAALPAGEATAVTVLTSGTLTGDIVAVGYKLNAGCTPDIQPVVVALTPAGALDPSFGTGGIADPNAPCGGRFNAVTTDSAGNIVAAGFTLTGGPPETLVARFSPGGTPDTSFASTGYASLQLGGALTSEASSVAIMGTGPATAGDIVVGGSGDFAAGAPTALTAAEILSTGANAGTLDPAVRHHQHRRLCDYFSA